MHTSQWIVNTKQEASVGEVSLILREKLEEGNQQSMMGGKRVTIVVPSADAAPMEPGVEVTLTLTPVVQS